VSGSKRRMLSISRSSMSIRYGVSEPIGKTSMSEPRTREFTMRDDLRDGRISRQRQLSAQSFEVQRVADSNFEGVGLDIAAGRQSLQQRVDGNQPDALSRARQFRQGGEPGRGDIGMRGEAVVGQGLQIGKDPYTRARAGKESNFIAEGFRIARALRDDDQRSLRARRGLRDGERRGCAIELAPFDDGRIGVGRVGSSRDTRSTGAKQKTPATNESRWACLSDLTILRDFGLGVRHHAVDDVVRFEIHDETRIFPARNRRVADGGHFGDRSSEFGRYLVHGHAAGRRGYIGLFDGNAVVDRNGLGPREAAGEHCRQQ